MSAIEYGSYYWCVLLNNERNGEHGQQAEESIYLHADEMSIEGGTLTFKSAGRRAAGTDPKSRNDSGGNGEGKPKESSENKEMIYIAFAPGSRQAARRLPGFCRELDKRAGGAASSWQRSGECRGRRLCPCPAQCVVVTLGVFTSKIEKPSR